MSSPLLTVRDVAETLRLSRAQVYAIKHRIGFVQLGRVIRFRPEDLERFIAGGLQGDHIAIGSIKVRDLAGGAPPPASHRSGEW